MLGRSMKSIPAPPLRLLRWAALALASGSAVAAIAGQGGRWNATLDVLNHFTPFWLAAGIVAFGFWSIHRAGRLIPTLAGIAVIVSALQVAPELFAGRGRASPVPGAETLKIVQFNLYGRNSDPRGTARWLLAQDADVVVVEEGYGQAKPVTRALNTRYPNHLTCAEPRPCPTAIFSKRPIKGGGGTMATMGFPAVWATIQGAGGAFTVAGAHYSWPIPAGPQQTERRVLAGIMSGFKQDRLIAAGDFNSTPWSFAMADQDKRFGLKRLTRALASWPAGNFSRFQLPFPLPFLPIDHVYAGKGWRAVSVRRGPRLGSDHFPVVVVLQSTAPSPSVRR